MILSLYSIYILNGRVCLFFFVNIISNVVAVKYRSDGNLYFRYEVQYFSRHGHSLSAQESECHIAC